MYNPTLYAKPLEITPFYEIEEKDQDLYGAYNFFRFNFNFFRRRLFFSAQSFGGTPPLEQNRNFSIFSRIKGNFNFKDSFYFFNPCKLVQFLNLLDYLFFRGVFLYQHTQEHFYTHLWVPFYGFCPFRKPRQNYEKTTENCEKTTRILNGFCSLQLVILMAAFDY